MVSQKDIFISYRREDGYLFAHLLAKELSDRGYSVFYDRSDLVAGAPFPEELTLAVTSCQEFLCVVTPMYLNAQKDCVRRIMSEEDWVRKEISLALTAGKRVIPILVGTDATTAFVDLPEDIGDLPSRNFLSYDSNVLIDDLISGLEKGFSEITVKNRAYQKLLQELYQIHDENDNNFNIHVRNMILQYSDDVVESKLIPLIEQGEEPEDICFAAFYAAFTFYRRLGYIYKLHSLVERYGQRFQNYRFSNIAFSQHYSFLFEMEGRNPEQLIQAVRYAQVALEKIPGNSGVLQNFADLITKSFELGVNRNKRQLSVAIDKIQEALRINPNYPKYHCTLGRLLSFQKKYNEAVISIQKAISLENMETKDSFLRTIEYNKHIYEVKLRALKLHMKRMIIGTAGGLALLMVISMILSILLLR